MTEEFMVMSFIYYYYGSTQANGVTHGERSAGVGSDGMIEMVLLSFYRLMFR